MPPNRCVVSLIAACIVASVSSLNAQTVAFVDVNVVPMDKERVVEGQTVIVRDGQIVQIGATSEVQVPNDATRVNGQGRFLMPGLAEMHGHLPLPNQNLPDRWPEDVLFLYVANGVTTVRGMQGQPRHLEMRDKLERGELLGPRIYVASPQYSGRSATSVGDAERLVREHKIAGFDLLKIQEGLGADVYHAIAKTADDVGIPFGGHVPNDVGFFNALDAGQITIDHLDNAYDAVGGDLSRISEVVNALVQHGAWVVPTEVLWETVILYASPTEALTARSELKYAPSRMVESWTNRAAQRRARGDADAARQRTEFRRALLAALNDAGAGILLGTDSPQMFSVPGFAMHREMEVMVEVGMTPYEVLRAGTYRVAEYFGTEATTGTVATGNRADLILLNANPLDDVGNVTNRVGVMVNGRWLSEEDIQERLRQIAAAYSTH